MDNFTLQLIIRKGIHNLLTFQLVINEQSRNGNLTFNITPRKEMNNSCHKQKTMNVIVLYIWTSHHSAQSSMYCSKKSSKMNNT